MIEETLAGFNDYIALRCDPPTILISDQNKSRQGVAPPFLIPNS